MTTLWEGKKTALLALAAGRRRRGGGHLPVGARAARRARPRSRGPRRPPRGRGQRAGGGRQRASTAVVTSNPAVLHRRKAEATRGHVHRRRRSTPAPSRAGAALTLAGRGVKAARVARRRDRASPTRRGARGPRAPASTARAAPRARRRASCSCELTLEGADAELRSLSVVTEAPNRAPMLSGFTFAKPKGKGDAAAPRRSARSRGRSRTPTATTSSPRSRCSATAASRWTALVKAEALDKPAHHLGHDRASPTASTACASRVSDSPEQPRGPRAHGRARLGARSASTTPRRASAPPRASPATASWSRARPQDQAGGQHRRACASRSTAAPGRRCRANDGLLRRLRRGLPPASLPSPGPGDHDVVVQALDADDNPGATAVPLTVSVAR